MSTLNHYENHLHKYYTWISGGIEDGVDRNKQFFQKQKILPAHTKTAIDLGAGSGIQSIALSELNFNVIAVDFSKKLLAELQENAKNTSITTIENNIINFDKYAGYKPELITCMGDTLTHLPSIHDVEKLITNCHNELVSGGKLILTFRDLSFQLSGQDRFIPVKSTSDTIFTCFIEYNKETVDVYDIVHKKKEGNWKQEISSYQKIKISENQIKDILNKTKFKLDFFEKKQGLITIIAVK